MPTGISIGCGLDSFGMVSGGVVIPSLPTGLIAAYVPSSIQQSAGLVTGWLDVSGNGNHIVTVPAAPAVVNLLGETWIDTTGSKYLTLPAGVSIGSRNGAVFAVGYSAVTTGSGNMVSIGSGLNGCDVSTVGDVTTSGLSCRVQNTAGAGANKLLSGFGWQLIGKNMGSLNQAFWMESETTTATFPTNATETGGYIGRWAGAANGYWNNPIKAVFVFGATVAAQQITDLKNYCQYYFQCGRKASLSVYAYDGDSITAGGVNGAIPWTIWVGSSMVYGTDESRPKFRNFAVGGRTTANVLANISGPTGWLSDNTKFTVLTKRRYLVMAGVNDLGTSVALATIQSNLTAIITAVHAGGYLAYIFTVLPATSLTGSKETDRLALNAWILAGSSGADGAIDLTGRSELQTPSNTTYFSDGTHPTSAGGKIIGEMAWPIVKAL